MLHINESGPVCVYFVLHISERGEEPCTKVVIYLVFVEFHFDLIASIPICGDVTMYVQAGQGVTWRLYSYVKCGAMPSDTSPSEVQKGYGTCTIVASLHIGRQCCVYNYSIVGATVVVFTCWCSHTLMFVWRTVLVGSTTPLLFNIMLSCYKKTDA